MSFNNGLPFNISVNSNNLLVIEEYNTEPDNEMSDSEYHVVRLDKETFLALLEHAETLLEEMSKPLPQEVVL